LKKHYLAGFVALVLILTVCTVLFAKAGKNEEDNETLYGHIIAKLGMMNNFLCGISGKRTMFFLQRI
jgi:hypothetical protein